MSENDLIELGFNRYDETAANSGSETDWFYYSREVGGVEFISNDSDDWERDGIEVSIMESDIRFQEFEDLNNLLGIISRNEK
jgi:hypothetical protein